METFVISLLLVCFFALYLRELRKRYGVELELNLFKERFSLRGLRAREFAHELKHPISAIITTLDSLSTSDDELNSDIKIITSEAKELYEFINNFLLICMAETGHLNGKPSSQDLNEVLNQIVKLLEVKASSKDISIQICSSLEGVNLFVDRTHLKQIFFNLINNAIDHNPEGTKVFIESSGNIDQDYFKVLIRDEGKGISPEEWIRLQDIFDGFRELKESSSATGLGLGLSSELTRFAGGHINIDENYEGGTCFQVSLPIATSKTSDTLSENKKVLLLSEGNSCSANIAKHIESLGCTVESISEVISALEALGNNEYDAVIVDHKIDNDSGFELAKLIDEELGLDETKKFVALSDEDFSPEIFSLSDKESWPIKREILKELIG